MQVRSPPGLRDLFLMLATTYTKKDEESSMNIEIHEDTKGWMRLTGEEAD